MVDPIQQEWGPQRGIFEQQVASALLRISKCWTMATLNYFKYEYRPTAKADTETHLSQRYIANVSFSIDVTGQHSWSPEYWNIWFGSILGPTAAESTSTKV